MRARIFVLAPAFVVLLACGGSTSSTPSEPVKSTPLTGTIDGHPWTPVAATASGHKAFSDGGEKWLDIGAKAFSCADFVPEAEVIGTVPWVAGTTYDLSLAHNLTLLTRKPDGGIVNNIATTGRVEIISAPGKDGGVGTIRIRASAGTGNSIEGQIDVAVCD